MIDTNKYKPGDIVWAESNNYGRDCGVIRWIRSTDPDHSDFKSLDKLNIWGMEQRFWADKKDLTLIKSESFNRLYSKLKSPD